MAERRMEDGDTERSLLCEVEVRETEAGESRTLGVEAVKQGERTGVILVEVELEGDQLREI